MSRSFRSSSRSLTFQHFAVLLEVFKFFFQDRDPLLLSSRTSTFQFLFVVSLEIFKVFTQDRVQQRVPSRTLTFQSHRGGLQDFLPVPGPAALSPELAGEAFQEAGGCRLKESLSDFEFEYFQYNDVWCARQWVPARRSYGWWIIDDSDGHMKNLYGGHRGSCGGGGWLWTSLGSCSSISSSPSIRVHQILFIVRVLDITAVTHSVKLCRGTVPVVVQRQVPWQGQG